MIEIYSNSGGSIAARDFESSGLSKIEQSLRALFTPFIHIRTGNKQLVAPWENPLGSACLAFILRYRLFMGNNHTT
ncbi:hypothetical protein ADS77_06005 [Pseudoalteromonas porphyrae]|uniref:Uncharacterized protein n=1 Tax=Pseudoalteromonas porphyrae TaxID=187330 RepID=A0A0N0M159_9GAMM|nr:hypothetical protein ADS77_06005 [Pseudoalteromonas porphyrae]